MNTSPATWTIGANWTNNGDGSYTAAANSGLLSTTISAVSSRRYLVSWTGIGNVVTITLGSVAISPPAQTANYIVDITANATGNLILSFQFGSTNTGTISAISIKELTPVTSRVPAQYIHTTSTGIGMELRSNLISHSIGVGLNSLGYLYTNGSIFGLYNTSLGELSLANITGGNYNTAIGYLALNALTTSEFNTAIGYRAGAATTIGNNNTFVGYLTGQSVTTGIRNVIIGSRAGSTATTMTGSVLIGFQAGTKLTTGQNIAIGDSALANCVTSNNNVVVGVSSMLNGTGQGNTMFGSQSGTNLTTGEYNFGVGYQIMLGLTTGSRNGFFGSYSGATGSSPTERLQQTLGLSSDSDNLFIGYYSTKQKLGSVINNSIAIGNHSRIYSDNQVVLGNTETTSTLLRGDVEVRNH